MITPTELLDFAREMLNGNNPPEIKIRTSISRSYYAAYHYAVRKYASKKNVTPRQVLDRGHAPFIRDLKKDTNPKLHRLGRQLEEIKMDREKADYDLNSDITKTAGAKAISCVLRAKDTVDSI